MKKNETEIKIMPLGAGREVGRSCVMVAIGDRLLMMDCGMHMGYNNYRQFPDFSFVAEGDLTKHIDCVCISHFHLDHSGSLPFFTEKVGYSGPMLMSAPTKSIAPLLLEDMRKVVQRRDNRTVWTEEDIKNCMAKATTIGLNETIEVKGVRITAYYAGHVLGATMFHIEYNGLSVLYTGDYNTASDRHLMGAALLPGLRPTCLISESTYGSTVRDSKRQRERDFLQLVHKTVLRGGKVLIPVFAMGRAQELLILIEAFWERMKLEVPIYFSAGMVGRANEYYKLYTSWTSDAVKGTFRSVFDFPHVGVFNNSLLSSPDPMVLFSTPGMLHAGASLEAFKAWCEDARSTVIIPGYCVEGTLGHTLLTTESPAVKIQEKTYNVQCTVSYMSFSAHADARGILKLIQASAPENVVLVHGDFQKAMIPLRDKVAKEMPHIRVHTPGNGKVVDIAPQRDLPVSVPTNLTKALSTDLVQGLADFRGFAAECLERLAKRRRVEGGGGGCGSDGCENQGALALTEAGQKWWAKWGVSLEDQRPTSAADNDCGCDVKWFDETLRRILADRPSGKYIPLTEGIDQWGVSETVRLVVTKASAGGGEGVDESFRVEAVDAAAFVEEHGLQEEVVAFKAYLDLDGDSDESSRKEGPLAGCDRHTLLPAIATLLKTAMAGTTFERSGETISSADGGVTVAVAQRDGRDCLLMEWTFPHNAVALRMHATLSDTLGIAI
eukprot:Rhum_TRINITY_DN4216_c0_g1::Rhum_TRINITY_DN4216_c0_g1_i1::g.13477::m.13477/K13148/CPSF3L, INTS11; integrator complex subunit 11